MKRIICCSLLLLSSLSLTATLSRAQHPGVKITVTPRQFVGFGQVQISKFIEKNVIIKNDSTSPQTAHVQINAPTGAQYTLVGGPRTVAVAPGQRDTLVVRFTPTAVGQALDSLMMIHDGDTTLLKNPVKEYLLGTALAPPDTFPKPSFSVQTINFRNVAIGTKLTRSIVIKNISDSIRTLVGTITPPLQPFAIDSGGAPFSLDSGKSQSVFVSFTPVAVGTFVDSVLIRSNADSALRLIKIRITGVGYIADTNHVSIKLLTRTLDFGSIDSGKVDSATFTLSNISDSSVKLVTQFQSPRSPFVLRGVTQFGRDTIAQRDSGVFTVVFRPVMPGTFSDSIVIRTNAYDSASQRVVIHLVGTAKSVAHTGGVSFVTVAPSMQAYPNPTTGFARIDLRGADVREVEIIDVTGSIVYSKQVNPSEHSLGSIMVDLSNRPAGSYFVALKGLNSVQIETLELIR